MKLYAVTPIAGTSSRDTKKTYPDTCTNNFLPYTLLHIVDLLETAPVGLADSLAAGVARLVCELDTGRRERDDRLLLRAVEQMRLAKAA